MHSAVKDTVVMGMMENGKLNIEEGNIVFRKAYSTSNDTLVVVMVLMETDGKGNIHVCYPVIIQTTYIMLLAMPHHHHQHQKAIIVN